MDTVEDAAVALPYVLMRWMDRYREPAHPDEVVVVGIYPDMAAVEERVGRLARANPQYPLVKLGETMWRIGPDEDEGFFGNRAVWIAARQPKGPA